MDENLAPNETVTVSRVYTFAGATKMIKLQVVGQNSESAIANATKAEETTENVAGHVIRVLVLKNDKNEVVGKFNLQHVAGWWQH